eukprot:TRINITY_DN12205_c0_g1_i1.p1 TRINITY_DN12205_c0_g1~~TRINITY_DN12205_c0_g1_i1.p1  ORF type:complete len:204 (-),score=28.69 TRINITY_DN12205_c0_g1_i1:19-630(-)
MDEDPIFCEGVLLARSLKHFFVTLDTRNSNKEEEYVSLAHFGKILEYFGPLLWTDGKTRFCCADNMKQALLCKNFGFKVDDSAERLSMLPAGSFIVRTSSTLAGVFSICRPNVLDSRFIQNVRDEPYFLCYLPDGTVVQKRDFIAAVQVFAKPLGLRDCGNSIDLCPVSIPAKYQAALPIPSYESSNDDDYSSYDESSSSESS